MADRFARPLGRWGLAAVAILDAALYVVSWFIPYAGPWPVEPVDPLAAGIRLIGEVLWLAATLLALSRGPTARVGWLLVAISVADHIWQLGYLQLAALYFLADTFRSLPAILLAHLIVAFPAGRLVGRFDRRLVGAIYGYYLLAGVIRLAIWEPDFACDPWCPRNPFAVLRNDGLVPAFDLATALVVPVIAIGVTVALVRHWRASGPARRRALLPVVVALPFAAAINSAFYIAQVLDIRPVLELLEMPIVAASGWILPAGILLGVARARVARAAAAGAIVELGTLPSPDRLETLLRERLGDPTLRVVRWSAAADEFLDREGSPVGTPDPEGGQALTTFERDGRPVAAIVHDRVLLDDPALAATMRRLLALTMDATELRDQLRARGGEPGALPAGEVTFLFGDVEGSTALLDALGVRYAAVLDELRRLVREVADRHGGRMVDAHGDEVFLAFPTAEGAVTAAAGIQARIAATRWPAEAKVRLRIGLHTGRPELTSGGYVGLDVHRAARVMGAANGGQILASASVVEALGGPIEPVGLRPLGRFRLRGIEEPVALLAVDPAGLEVDARGPAAEPAM